MKNTKHKAGMAEILLISAMFLGIMIAVAYQMKHPCTEEELGEKICLVYTTDHGE